LRISTVQHVSFLALLVLVTLSFFGLISEFLQPLFWAAVISILFHRLQLRWIRVLGGRPSAAAALSTLVILVIVILPFFLMAAAVAREALGLYERVASGQSEFQETFQYIEKTLPEAVKYLDRFGFDLQKIEQRLSDTALVVSRYLGSQMVTVGQGTIEFLLKFFLMLYILYFFFRDGDRILHAIGRALPFGDIRERRLFEKFAEVSRATIKGTMIVGLIQGTLGGLLFWILGIRAPVFWGVIMTVFSLLPAVGSVIVWGPAGIILIVMENYARGIILLAAGALVIGLVDNILRPVLVGRDTKMPDFLILLSTLGGLTVFGISGFVIGPIIAALFLTIWDIFAREYSEKENHKSQA